MIKKNYFQLFANCLIVKGASRSTICDLQAKEVFILPNEIADIIESLNNRESISSIKKEFHPDEEKIIDEALLHLENKNFGFFCEIEEFDLFPDLDTTYKTANQLNDIIVELDFFDFEKLQRIKEIARITSSKSLHFVCYFSLSKTELNKLLKLFNLKSLSTIEIIMKYHNNQDKAFFEEAHLSNPRFKKVILHGSSFSEENYFQIPFFTSKHLETTFTDFSFCGTISKKYFTLNQEKFLESLNFNSCLNQKLAIDRKGNIKNCPALDLTFGNIKNTEVEFISKELLNSKDYTKLTSIKKDDINDCKVCEFRHICTDCRAFLSEPINPLSKPLKCSYNPYRGEWS
ncbi:grasp-with-spasm system SPASM domain peptide maturase [Tenacibaculum ascidiaceicola]|uniref:grasp-with-spasm system SPASM domain peptide maturase n=1 Tax=Tenacibaculum ascidiaceicola TaxID=1699411 RepID=UPI0038930B87